MRLNKNYSPKRGFALGILIGLCIVSLTFITSIELIDVNDNIIYKAQRFVSKVKFNSISLEWQDKTLINAISITCSKQPNQTQMVECVNDYIRSVFNFQYHHIGNILRMPEDIVEKGGVCRDYTVFYKAVLNNMGIKSEFISSNTHIYLKVYPDNQTCILDQRTFYCVEKDI
ncbi:MAG: transglutaminase-like domain-containing protein [Candidatus Nanoarchaeia archaeon]